MAEADFEDEFNSELLKVIQGRRRAEERWQVFMLVRSGSILLVSVASRLAILAWLIHWLLQHSDLPSVGGWFV